MKNRYLNEMASTLLFALLISTLTGCMKHDDRTAGNSTAGNNARIKAYNVVWDSPGRDHHGSMPAGNGDIGINLWVEQNGDICFYIGKTDSWGDNGRLLKVGKIRVTSEPALLFTDAVFRQELDLETGTIQISSHGTYGGQQADIHFSIWVDANHPVIHISQNSSVPVKLRATAELWRTAPSPLPEIGTSDLLEDRSKPGSMHEPVIVEPDSVIRSSGNYIGWYHHNKKSAGFDVTNALQGLSEYYQEDPILHRTFGAIVSGPDAVRVNDTTLRTNPAKTGRLNVCVSTLHPADPGQWLAATEELMTQTDAIPFEQLYREHKQWWNRFWDRSWIYATSLSDTTASTGKGDAFVVSRAYALQRFIDASAGRGHYPIKFNGSIFTVPYPDKPGNADYRRWGPGYWWQNTRLPYLSMCAAGDYDLMQPFFNMYAGEVFKLNRYRTKKYFGFEGAYFPECIYFWGSVFTSTYGWTPYEVRTDKLQQSGYHKWEWVSGPELVFMMLDYYDYTGDRDFLEQKIIPVASEVIRFFDNFYKTGDDGKLVMHPSQAVETWWDCTNPMPELAGLYGITRRLLALPEDLTTDQERQFWTTFFTKLPAIPLRETPSGKALAPASRFEDKRNVENPELYALFPFRLYGVGNPDMELAMNALEHRWDKGDFGWRQDDIFMAYLGLAEQARDNLVNRSKNFDKNARFPAFWGPNYDWTPDQDHGGVLMKTFQSMLMQADPYSRKIYLLPAWPGTWDADFKLHAPYQTIIEGKVRNGTIEKLHVTPASRRKDIIMP